MQERNFTTAKTAVIVLMMALLQQVLAATIHGTLPPRTFQGFPAKIANRYTIVNCSPSCQVMLFDLNEFLNKTTSIVFASNSILDIASLSSIEPRKITPLEVYNSTRSVVKYVESKIVKASGGYMVLIINNLQGSSYFDPREVQFDFTDDARHPPNHTKNVLAISLGVGIPFGCCFLCCFCITCCICCKCCNKCCSGKNILKNSSDEYSIPDEYSHIFAVSNNSTASSYRYVIEPSEYARQHSNNGSAAHTPTNHGIYYQHHTVDTAPLYSHSYSSFGTPTSVLLFPPQPVQYGQSYETRQNSGEEQPQQQTPPVIQAPIVYSHSLGDKQQQLIYPQVK